MKTILRLLGFLFPVLMLGATYDVRINQQTAAGSYPNIYIAATGTISSTATFRSALGIPGLTGGNSFTGDQSITGNLSLSGSISTGVGGSVAGHIFMGQGTPTAASAGQVGYQAPASVTTPYAINFPSSPLTGLVLRTGTSDPQTETTVTAIPNGYTATTQTAADNSTKIATTAYSDTAARATHLGTFASPDTTAGAVTWVSPVLDVYTSASGGARTYTLPLASSYTGQAIIINVVAGTNHVNIQPQSGKQLVLAGVLLTADHYVQAATSAAGNYICFKSDGTNWNSLGSSGTWADSASP